MHLRVVPWSHKDELDELKNWFYERHSIGTDEAQNKSDDMRLRAIERVNSYHCRGSQYVPHVIASTAQLTASILLDEKFQKNENSTEEISEQTVRLSYTMSIIRYVNGLLDPSQQAVFAIPLHVLAKKIKLSSWLVDLRHYGTHERELPSLEMLRLASKECLDWLWNNYWNDDVLEEISDDDEAEENQMKYFGINTNDLINIIHDISNIKVLLMENKWIWETERIQVIKSKNFTIDETEVQKRSGNRKKRKLKDIPVPELINNYISTLKNLWKKSTDKQSFVEICIMHYHSIVFDVCFVKIPEFNFEVLRWLCKILSPTGDKSNIKRFTEFKKHFSEWKKVKSSLFNPLFENINQRTIGHIENNWDNLINKELGFLSLYICESILLSLKSRTSTGKRRNKKRDANTKEQDLIKRIERYFSDNKDQFNENEMIELFSSHSTDNKNIEQTNDKLIYRSDDLSSILDDLNKLKERSNKKPKMDNTNIQKPIIWREHPKWDPKPFGVL